MPRRGFTLLELLVVLAIMSLLAALVAPTLVRSYQGVLAHIEIGRAQGLIEHAGLSAYTRDEDLRVEFQRAELLVKGADNTVLARRGFDHLRFEPAVVEFSRHGFTVSPAPVARLRSSGVVRELGVARTLRAGVDP